MAIMYPESIDFLGDDRLAEKEVFSQLKTLNDDYSIFHSVDWTGKGFQSECDFVIFNAKKGFITLEVKGGKEIGIDKWGKWYSINFYGKKYEIKDPIKQASSARWFFIREFQELYNIDFRGTHGWAVCFPHTNWNRNFYPIQLNEDRVLDLAGMKQIDAFMNRVFYSFNYNETRPALSENEKNKFIGFIRPSNVSISASIDYQIRKQEEKINEIAKFQDYLIEILDDRKKLVFQGSAGTGKTWFAKKKTIKLVKEAKKVLFLCYNAELKNSIASELAEYPEIKIQTFPDWGRNFIRKLLAFSLTIDEQKTAFLSMMTKIAALKQHQFVSKSYCDQFINEWFDWLMNIDKTKDSYLLNTICMEFQSIIPDLLIKCSVILISQENLSQFYSQNLPNAILEVLSTDFKPEYYPYDALIIDEAQDFSAEWCSLMDMVLENSKDPEVYLFYDDNQNIFTKSENMPIKDFIQRHAFPLYQLKYNIRNTRSIHQLAIERTHLAKTSKPFHETDLLKPVEKYFHLKDKNKILADMNILVKDLIENNKIAKNRMVFLSNRALTNHNSIFEENINDNKYSISKKYTLSGNAKDLRNSETLHYQTIQKIKGLEFDIVILLLYKDKYANQSENEIRYIGYTRAKHLLYVYYLDTE